MSISLPHEGTLVGLLGPHPSIPYFLFLCRPAWRPVLSCPSPTCLESLLSLEKASMEVAGGVRVSAWEVFLNSPGELGFSWGSPRSLPLGRFLTHTPPSLSLWPGLLRTGPGCFHPCTLVLHKAPGTRAGAVSHRSLWSLLMVQEVTPI